MSADKIQFRVQFIPTKGFFEYEIADDSGKKLTLELPPSQFSALVAYQAKILGSYLNSMKERPKP